MSSNVVPLVRRSPRCPSRPPARTPSCWWTPTHPRPHPQSTARGCTGWWVGGRAGGRGGIGEGAGGRSCGTQRHVPALRGGTGSAGGRRRQQAPCAIDGGSSRAAASVMHAAPRPPRPAGQVINIPQHDVSGAACCAVGSCNAGCMAARVLLLPPPWLLRLQLQLASWPSCPLLHFFLPHLPASLLDLTLPAPPSMLATGRWRAARWRCHTCRPSPPRRAGGVDTDAAAAAAAASVVGREGHALLRLIIALPSRAHPPRSSGCTQGKHRLLFLLFKQSGRVTVRPPSKRQGFQARGQGGGGGGTSACGGRPL